MATCSGGIIGQAFNIASISIITNLRMKESRLNKQLLALQAQAKGNNNEQLASVMKSLEQALEQVRGLIKSQEESRKSFQQVASAGFGNGPKNVFQGQA